MRRVSLIAIAIPVLLGLAPTGADAQHSALVSSNGVLVFVSDRDGEPDLFTLDPSTSTVAKLTTRSGAAELQPAWSPNGQRIAYVRRGGITGRADLWVMKASGRGRTRVTSTPVPERDPSWSPDGSHLTYAARTGPGEPFRIFVANADGSAPDQLTTQAAGSADRSPVWSPDGSRIAFVSNRAGGFPELYLMFADGSGVVRLTTNSSIDANPSWSPDGTRLVFERCCDNGTSDLLTIDIATRAEASLTPSSTQQDFDPVWAPDGTRIAFVSFEVGQGNLDIWVMNADGTAPVRLTQEAGPDLAPHWQPIPA